ncbi:MAG: gamma-glutamyl-gamma-aminobutyrate hydrolase family protein, partial [Bacilli bacterium]|nr:gamma-glutamyl-gamma-aminobutyrate hydrolase family protein [Bacilli bacterium]
LKSAGYYHLKKVIVNYIDANTVNDENVGEVLANMDGILVPGGFGKRGSEGKISAIKYARENKIPMLGICYGMQLACIEYARNVFSYADASSTEIDPDTKHPIIYLLPDQYAGINMGGTLRLGLYDCHLKEDSLVYKAYGKSDIKERHRHRYEFNNDFSNILEKDLKAVGINERQNLVEIVELKNHPFFVGCQFHPEFLSRPDRPHPLFREFINASINTKHNKGE